MYQLSRLPLRRSITIISSRSCIGEGTVSTDTELVLESLKRAFDAGPFSHTSTLRNPVSWPEMLFLPSTMSTPSYGYGVDIVLIIVGRGPPTVSVCTLMYPRLRHVRRRRRARDADESRAPE
jgi:hypothetical protein